MRDDLERLTADGLRRAEERAKGKSAGWYELCRRGYLPAEIAVHADPLVFATDVSQRVRQYAERYQLAVPVSCATKRVHSVRAAPEDWRAAFRSTVMRTGMCLALTQPMLEFLCATADGVVWDRGIHGATSLAKPDNFIVTGAALEKRGLIRRRPPARSTDDDDIRASVWETTEAGEAVVALLKSVGVFVEADAAIEKRGGTA